MKDTSADIEKKILLALLSVQVGYKVIDYKWLDYQMSDNTMTITGDMVLNKQPGLVPVTIAIEVKNT